MPWYTGKTGCGCCGGEDPVDPDGCDKCSSDTPAQLKVTVTGISDLANCPFASQANGVYILNHDPATCSWTLCVTYPKDADGFSLGPCFYDLESIDITVVIGSTGNINLFFRQFNGSDSCAIGPGVTTTFAEFQDTVHMASIGDDCTLIDTTYSTGTLNLIGGSGFGGVPWGSGTIRLEAI